MKASRASEAQKRLISSRSRWHAGSGYSPPRRRSAQGADVPHTTNDPVLEQLKKQGYRIFRIEKGSWRVR